MKTRLTAALFCCAAVLGAQTAKTLLGTVTEFKANSFQIGLKLDSGEALFFPFGTETEVVQIPPGERDLGKATPAAVTGILLGDRVMVSFVPDMAEARRIVLISSRDISKRNEAEKLDWQKRGISGIAASQKGSEITVEIRTPQGAHTAIISVTEKTKIRRYAPDSVKFTDALASGIGEIAAGDQVRARGLKSEDGSKLAAEEVVFGSFLTRLGPITAINREAGEIQIQEVTTKRPLTIRVIADSQLKKMPDMRAMMAPRPAGEHAAPAPSAADGKGFDIQTAMERLPAARIDDLKVGGSVIVTSTKGAKSDTVTAILLLANADFLVQMAQGQGSGEGGMDAINRLHGGMLAGRGGFSLPTMLQ
jgi:DNA gyrase/topoisomerase IV subunit A